MADRASRRRVVAGRILGSVSLPFATDHWSNLQMPYPENAPLEEWLAQEKPEDVLEPGLPIIDPHHHLWDMRGTEAPWERSSALAAFSRQAAANSHTSDGDTLTVIR